MWSETRSWMIAISDSKAIKIHVSKIFLQQHDEMDKMVKIGNIFDERNGDVYQANVEVQTKVRTKVAGERSKRNFS